MNVLVDTSVWIEWLNGRRKPEENFLESVVVCGPIVQEVLQGLKNTYAAKEFKESFLEFPVVSDPLSVDMFVQASEIFRTGRLKGFTIRSSADCLIAAIAIKLSIPVMHLDRDFESISKFTSLELY